MAGGCRGTGRRRLAGLGSGLFPCGLECSRSGSTLAWDWPRGRFNVPSKQIPPAVQRMGCFMGMSAQVQPDRSVVVPLPPSCLSYGVDSGASSSDQTSGGGGGRGSSTALGAEDSDSWLTDSSGSEASEFSTDVSDTRRVRARVMQQP